MTLGSRLTTSAAREAKRSERPSARAFARRYMQRVAHPPTWDQAGTYSAVNHYLKAIKALGSKDADTVMRILNAR